MDQDGHREYQYSYRKLAFQLFLLPSRALTDPSLSPPPRSITRPSSRNAALEPPRRLLVHTAQLAYLTTKTTLDPISLDAPPQKQAAHADQTDPPESSLQEQPSGQKMISADEVAKHDSREDCWVIIQVSLVGFNRERVAGG